MRRKNGAVAVGLVRRQRFGNLIQINRGICAEIKNIYLDPARLRGCGPALPEPAGGQDQNFFSCCHHIGKRCVPDAVTVADIHRDLGFLGPPHI